MRNQVKRLLMFLINKLGGMGQNDSSTPSQQTPQPSADNQERRNFRLYWKISGVLVLIVLARLLMLYLFDSTDSIVIPSMFGDDVEIRKTYLYLGLLIGYGILSYVEVQADQTAVLLFLGRSLFNLGPGPFLAWYILCKMVYGPITRRQREFPADSEKVWRGNTETMPTDGSFVEPYRVTTGGANQDEVKSPLDGRLTVDITFFAAFVISNMRKFVRAIGITHNPPEELADKDRLFVLRSVREGALIADVDEAFRQLQDRGKQVLNGEFAKRSPKEILEQQMDIAEILANELNTLISKNDWGVDLQEVALSSIDLGKRINEALADLAKAGYDKQATILAGEADARVIFVTGEQEALVRKLKLEAEATGYKALATELNVSQDDMIAFINARLVTEAIGKVGENQEGKLVIVGGGGGASNVINSILGLAEQQTSR